MSFIPDWPTLLTYTLACAVLYLTPGPDMSLFLAKTLSGGKRAGLAAFLGACTGCLVHTLAAAIGLSALLAASTTAFGVLKVVGAVYLLWLAIDVLRSGSSLNVTVGDSHREPLLRTFLLGCGINLTNPKVVLFFVTFLPQFVHAGDPAASGQLLFLGLYFIAFTIPLGVLTIAAAGQLVAWLKGRPRVLRVIDWLFASVFAYFAVRILAAQNR
jgi:threonine/homoserine/homoserine lactone efflux protein